MAKIKNKRITSTDHEFLKRLADELEYIGRYYHLDLSQDLLIQYALPPQKPKKKREKEHTPRNKKAESAARHH